MIIDILWMALFNFPNPHNLYAIIFYYPILNDTHFGRLLPPHFHFPFLFVLRQGLLSSEMVRLWGDPPCS